MRAIYPRITRVLAFTLLLALIGTASAETTPPRGKTDPRVRIVPYSADEVYRLEGFVGYDIHIELESGEEYQGFAAGDSNALTVDARGNDLFIKPRVPAVDTNITVITSRRRYQFAYHASTRTPDPAIDDVIYSLRFAYSQVPQPESERHRVDAALAHPNPDLRTNEDYWYCGAKALKPTAASDDGVHTRLTFASRGELPALFARNEDGSESLLNFSIDGGVVVIHRVAPRIILRRGHLVGCVVNRAYSGSGERLPTGTVSPDVERTRAGGEP
jgi:type IV secretion system protein VirB9